jgi:hypothetical protein
MVLGGQHPSCVGLAKNNKKKQGIEKKQTTRNKGRGQQRRSQKLLALNTGYYFLHGRTTLLTKKYLFHGVAGVLSSFVQCSASLSHSPLFPKDFLLINGAIDQLAHFPLPV